MVCQTGGGDEEAPSKSSVFEQHLNEIDNSTHGAPNMYKDRASALLSSANDSVVADGDEQPVLQASKGGFVNSLISTKEIKSSQAIPHKSKIAEKMRTFGTNCPPCRASVIGGKVREFNPENRQEEAVIITIVRRWSARSRCPAEQELPRGPKRNSKLARSLVVAIPRTSLRVTVPAAVTVYSVAWASFRR